MQDLEDVGGVRSHLLRRDSVDLSIPSLSYGKSRGTVRAELVLVDNAGELGGYLL